MESWSVLSEVLPDWRLSTQGHNENQGLCPSECITFEGLPTYFLSMSFVLFWH